jgi:hypothetical protein
MIANDALITHLAGEAVYGVSRPSTAIRLADTDGNPATIADPAWTPLLVNPPYPDYVSGYNAFAASTTRTLDDLFGSTAPRHNPDLDRRARSRPSPRQRPGRTRRRRQRASMAWHPLPLRRCRRP